MVSARKYMINHVFILAEVLSRKLTLRPGYEAWIGSVNPVFRQYRATAVLCAAGFGGVASIDVGRLALSMLKRNDLKTIKATELLNSPGAPLRLLPGAALAKITDIGYWYTEAWSSLRPEREQSWRHIYGQGEVDADPAQIMAIWGLGVLETLAKSEALSSRTRGMWLALEATFREARLTEPSLGDRFWSQAISCLFSYWPSAFIPTVTTETSGSDSSSGTPDLLSNALFPYVGVSGDFIGIVVSLHQAGVELTAIREAVLKLKYDLLHVVRRFSETTRRLKDVRVWNPAWVATLQRIETVLVSTETQLSTPS